MSTVIKAGQSGTVVRRLSTVDLADHLNEAAEIIARAQREAAAILRDSAARAQREAQETGERARREGYERGFAEGTAAGRVAALQEAGKEYTEKLTQLGAMFQAGIAEMESIKERLRLDAMQDVLEFSIAAASKLTFAIGELRRESAVENLRRCLALVTDKTAVSVRCNPRDLDSLRTFAESIAERAVAAVHVRLTEDESVSPGGCIVSSGGADIDASLETQIAELTAALTGKSDHG